MIILVFTAHAFNGNVFTADYDLCLEWTSYLTQLIMLSFILTSICQTVLFRNCAVVVNICVHVLTGNHQECIVKVSFIFSDCSGCSGGGSGWDVSDVCHAQWRPHVGKCSTLHCHEEVSTYVVWVCCAVHDPINVKMLIHVNKWLALMRLV